MVVAMLLDHLTLVLDSDPIDFELGMWPGH